MSEQDPLLGERGSEGYDGDRSVGKAVRTVGPLDISRSTRYGILAGLWSATFLSALNQTLVPTSASAWARALLKYTQADDAMLVIPSISSEFNRSNQASWLGTSYLLATCTFTPLYGRLCNVLGRKGANHTALVFAGAGVLMCGLSNSMEMLITARFLSGIGGGGLMTTSSIIVSDMYSMRSRGLTQGVASVFNGLGLGFGGPFGGLITDWLGWRWAFLIQIPLFFVSYCLTTYNLNYVTEGTGKSTKEILRRIDYLGSASLMMTVGSILMFLSARYNETLPWSNPRVIISITSAAVFSVIFFLVELFVSPEPVLAPFLLRRKIPVLVGFSNFLVAICNFSIVYFFPMWFQTVCLTNASTAGLHLLPNSLSMSTGSLFAGWMMHKTGRYKKINLVFGAFPFIAAVFIYHIREDSGPIQSWFSIIPLGFGNAVVLQTMLIALLVHVPENCMAIGTGFGQLFRGVGQVGGVAISSAIFQSKLETELRKRIQGPDADDWVKKIRQNARLIIQLDPDMQRKARDAYSVSLKSVFFFAACSTLLAYIVRLPIPDKKLEHRKPRPKSSQEPTEPSTQTSSSSGFDSHEEPASSSSATPFDSDGDDDNDNDFNDPNKTQDFRKTPRRRLSTYENADEVIADLEQNKVANTGRMQR
uniref:Major facilitator superfamily (MFS) profile domain-containing protein n=1 Tax=Psilocybe cubensis TaxID=181762 RepID=A0A8H7XZJ5_PSICU